MLSNLVPNVPVSVKINLVYASASMYIAVQEGIGQSSNLLYSTMTNGSVNFTFVPTQSSVQLSMELLFNKVPLTAFSYSFTLDSVSYTQQTGANSSTQLVQISNKQRDKYRFGYNGQEKDNEIAGVGNHNTAEFWEYDTRVGRRWNTDPVVKPWESSYACFANNPIWYSDVNGDEPSLVAYQASAKRLGLSINQIRTVYMTEVGENAYFKGKAKILFERHYFNSLTNGKFDKSNPKVSNSEPGGYGSYDYEYEKLNEAIGLDKDAAYMSASYGGFQIMGKNYKSAGFSSAEDMYKALTSDNEDLHLQAFTSFILNDKTTNPKKGVTMTKLNALRNNNWLQFAMGYNGPNQKKYDEKLKSNFKKLTEKKSNNMKSKKDNFHDEHKEDNRVDRNEYVPN